jgi:SAM-dependent methyltransferase
VSEPADPWSFVQPWDVEALGDDLLDPNERKRWARAMFVAGGLPFMWRELAGPVRDIVYALLELRAGDRVLLIGEGIGPCGFATDIEERVGPAGTVDAIEIILDGRKAVAERTLGRNGKIGCWKWEYARGVADGAYDVVAVLQSAQHCDDWNETGRELLRVMKPGRRIVMAEMVLAGARFDERVRSDVHIHQWYAKMFPGGRDHISNYTHEELLALCGDLVDGPQAMEWHGIELFWGRKPAG